MTNKRQTIWLVSMLSLMVVLSAYYLFTEDSGTPSQVAESQQTKATQPSDAQEASANNTLDGLVVNEVVTEDQGTGEQTDETGAPVDPEATQEDAATTGKTDAAKTDEEVLKEVEAQNTSASAATVFENYQWERTAENSRIESELMAAAGDNSKTPEENAKAVEQLRMLEEKNSKITGIEEQLSQQYTNAIVEEDNDQYKVVVISDKLEAKDAVGIVDMVIKELDVTQDKVRVQYVKE
ncbi:SpoIIIAH-like family protein [Paenibacillus sp. Marseille-Q4541]|uniref:SpoIIIAH-like family protein n=1 Tax=Paenibacillus sp. Marseille-Q4541 TaxID=2831522 RepID=UPI001BA6EADF|nr:SpoIIIAH-like family protein [Paenibacillus sp. Marseille-Q4541]